MTQTIPNYPPTTPHGLQLPIHDNIKSNFEAILGTEVQSPNPQTTFFGRTIAIFSRILNKGLTRPKQVQSRQAAVQPTRPILLAAPDKIPYVYEKPNVTMRCQIFMQYCPTELTALFQWDTLFSMFDLVVNKIRVDDTDGFWTVTSSTYSFKATTGVGEQDTPPPLYQSPCAIGTNCCG